MANDAELSVGIEDNLTPVLAKMAAQTRAFGAAMGAESKQIDKAVRGVTKSINDLGGAGASNKNGLAQRTRTNTKALEEQRKVIAANRLEVERLSRAEGAVRSKSSFSGWRDANGKGISAKEVRDYEQAIKRLAESEERLNKIRTSGQTRGAGQFAPMKAAVPVGFKQYQDQLKAAQKAAEDAAAASAKAKWWPPDMLRGSKQFTTAMMGMSNSVRYAMYDVSRNAAIGGAAILALGVGAVVVAAKWERAFADVERTVQGTPQTLDRIRQGLMELSQDIPVAFSDLAQIASVGGQMGINAQGIVAYTETIAKLTATTNLTADAAGKALGRFKAFFPVIEGNDASLAVTDQTFSNLASSILKVGVNSVATESGIVNVATQISSMGSYAGLTADQVIGLAGALSSVGVPPELSRGVITRLFGMIGEAVAEGGGQLKAFADLAGVSAAEFTAAWGTENFGYVFTDMIAGLGAVQRETGSAVGVLHELGVTSVRDVPVLLRLAGAANEAGEAGGLLAQTMNDARSGWRQNIELQLQYAKISDTLVERTKVLMQNFEALFATMGQSSVGPVKAIVEGLTQLVKGFTSLAATPVGQTLGVVSVAATVLAGSLLLVVAGGARAFAALQGVAAGMQAVGISAATAAPLVRGIGIAMGALGAIGALAAIVGTIAAIASASNEANNAITDTQGALAAMQEDAKAGSGFVFTDGLSQAREGIASTSSQADNLGKVLGHTTDKLYGTAAAADEAGSSMQTAALRYGEFSAELARTAVTGQKGFTDLFDGDFGTKFADNLAKGGFDLDRALKIAATKDEAAVRKYLESVVGEFGNEQSLTWNVNPDVVMDRELENRAVSLLSILSASGGQFSKVAKSAYASGEALITFSNAADITADSMEDFTVQNEDAINSMGAAFQKFVDSGSLIGLTQQLSELQKMQAGDEKDKAAEGFAKAWQDAYGGAAFSLETYMNVFRRAAGEQEKFTQNLQTLTARGVDSGIIGDLAAMGPQAQQLVQALVNSTDEQLDEYVALYGKTGAESMIALAAGQLAAQGIVQEAAKTLSNAQLLELSADLAAGTPLIDAMAKWNLDAAGKPMKAPVEKPLVPNLSFYDKERWAWNNGLYVRVTPVITQTALNAAAAARGITGVSGWQMKYTGGYTGPGPWHKPVGTVHAGEYVHKKSDVDQSTGMPKAAVLMRMLSGGRPSRGSGGPGYAGGGYVTAGVNVTALSPDDRALLRMIARSMNISIDGEVVAGANQRANFASTRQGQGL